MNFCVGGMNNVNESIQKNCVCSDGAANWEQFRKFPIIRIEVRAERERAEGERKTRKTHIKRSEKKRYEETGDIHTIALKVQTCNSLTQRNHIEFRIYIIILAYCLHNELDLVINNSSLLTSFIRCNYRRLTEQVENC